MNKFSFAMSIIWGAFTLIAIQEPTEINRGIHYGKSVPMPKPVPALMVYPAELDGVYNSFITNIYPDITAKQSAYYNNNGKYFQGVYTHSTVPTVGMPSSADRLGSKPTDQFDNWLDFGLLSLNTDYMITINTAAGPTGQGYTIKLTTKASDGNTYTYLVGVGAHSETRGWE